ncbi:polyprenyl synthetase family protein [Gemmatimonadota bacterium]
MIRSSSLLRQAPPDLDQIKAPVLDRLDQVLEEIRRIVVADFEMIEEVNDYLLVLPGKLFRPTLLLLANEVGGRPHEDAVTFAAAVELVHLATLVHDDAVDNSVLRRGQPTVNSIWSHQIAIIMGDYLYSRAVTELARVGHLEAIEILGDAANVMSVGEMRQLTAYDALDFSEDDYFRLIASKTASLMGAACGMGALVGVRDYQEPLLRYGHNLGMAFQIADDILDYVGSEEETGKPVGHDLREKKVTLPLVGALKAASPGTEAEITKFFTGIDPADKEIARIVALVTELGGVEYARQRALEYAERAEEALEGLHEGPALSALRDSINYVVDRNR